MDLREIRKEVADLQPLPTTVKKLQDSWLRPFHKDHNQFSPFLQNMHPKTRAEINKKLAHAEEHLEEIKDSQIIHQRLHRLSHTLVELKLNLLQNDRKKAKALAKQLTSDELLNVKQTLADVKVFEEKVAELSTHYHDINDLVHHNLPLEEAVIFMEMPHYSYIRHLQATAQQQKRIARDLGRHLVSVTKEASLKYAHRR